MSVTTAAFFVTTPYIDAYETSNKFDVASSSIVMRYASFEEFHKMMSSQASFWGEHGLGRALIEGHDLPEADGGLVLAIGIWNGTSYAFVATPGPGWYDTRRMIEFNYPVEWNVT